MNLNLDNLIASSMSLLLPWDLTLTLKGQTLVVRPLTNADLASLAAINAMEPEQQKALIAGLFSPAPDLEQWDDLDAAAATSAVVNYFRTRSAKNSRAISDRVAAEMATTARSGK